MGSAASATANYQRNGICARWSNMTFATVLAFVAVLGRVVVAPIMLLMVFGATDYLAPAKMFIGSKDSYLAFSAQDAVMIGACLDCNIGCLKSVYQMSFFGSEAIMSKPLFENLYTMENWDFSTLNPEALALGKRLETDGTVCMSGLDNWGSTITTIKGTPQMVVDIVETLNLSVTPQALLEVTLAIETVIECPTAWALEAHLHLFKFAGVGGSTEFSAVSVADFTIFPERTECRPNVLNSGLVGSKLALATDGIDILAVVPEILKLFPYGFDSSLPRPSRTIAAAGVPEGVLQPLLHAYYGGCRVCEVNMTGIYIEDACTINKHWVNYGLMVPTPDDIPVCSTGDVCVHNYYNSLWEMIIEEDPSLEGSLTMSINAFRSRFADSVQLNMLPGIVVAQMLVMGIISLYQVMSHKRSVLLTQIWAYRCQNGRMQVIYLVQIMYHLITSSDLYYLGLATGTLTTEALTNLALCFFAFSYSFVNLLKSRSGEQELARHFRLTWETMQVFITVCTTYGLYTIRQTSVLLILNYNGELLRKTNARGAATCNLSDSCIVFKYNLVLVAITTSLALGAAAGIVSYITQKHTHWKVRRAEIDESKSGLNMRSIMPQDAAANATEHLKTLNMGRPIRRPRMSRFGYAVKPEPPKNEPSNPKLGIRLNGKSRPVLTSFERHCLGTAFSNLFTDCADIAYITHKGMRCSTVEAILLTGYLFYGEHVYQAQDVVLLLVARLLPRKFIRTFNVLFLRWHVNESTGRVSYPHMYMVSCK